MARILLRDTGACRVGSMEWGIGVVKTRWGFALSVAARAV